MKRFTKYFEKSEKKSGYLENAYPVNSVFVLEKQWESYSQGSEFTLTENELPDKNLKLGIGITKALFRDPNGNFIEITGSKNLLESTFIFKPIIEKEQPDATPIQPVVIVEKEIVQTLPPEIPVDVIRQVVEEMMVIGPKGERGPAGPPGKTIIIEKQQPVNSVQTSTEFDFGTIEKESSPGLSIDLGSL